MEINKVSKELESKNKFKLYGEIIKIDYLGKDINGNYKCNLNIGKSNIKHSHVKKCNSKIEAIEAALEHLAMMGYNLH